MDKKRLVRLIVIFSLGFLSVYIYLNQSSGTYKPGEVNFALVETDQPDEILILKQDTSLIFTKENNQWILNNTIDVRPAAINLLIKMLGDLQVKATVLRKDKNIVEKMVETGYTIAVKKNDKTINRFSLAFNKSGNLIYAKMPDSDTHFIIHIPGIDGNITGILQTDINYWRNNTLVNVLPHEIQSLDVLFHNNTNKNFKLKRIDNRFELSYQNDKNISIDQEALKQYLLYFSDVSFDFILEEQPQDIAGNSEFISVSLLKLDGTTRQIKAFRKLVDNEIDVNNLYCLINNETWVHASYLEVDGLFKDVNYLRKK